VLKLSSGIQWAVWEVLVSLDNQMRRVYHKTCYASCIKTASLRIEMENPCSQQQLEQICYQ